MIKFAEEGLNLQETEQANSETPKNAEKGVKQSNDKLIEEKELTQTEMADKKKGTLVRFKTSYGWVSFRTKKKKGR